MKKSAFYDTHKKAGATMHDGAWCTPSVYTTIEEEHDAVRNHVAITDWSPMGKFDVKGPDAGAFLQKMIVNDINSLSDGGVIYGSMLNEQGRFFDDTTVYRFNENHYMMVAGISSRAKNNLHFKKHSAGMNAYVTDVTSGVGLMSLQGPKSRDLLNKICDTSISHIEYFTFDTVKIGGCDVIVSRTGFTGELGYELYINSEDCAHVVEITYEAGKAFNIKFCGMSAAVDILRVEKGYVVDECSDEYNPLEAGLGWTVKFNTDFIGKEALMKVKEQGVVKKLMGVILNDASKLATVNGKLYDGDKVIGKITCSCYSPALKKSISLCYIDTPHAKIDSAVQVDIDGGKVAGTLCSKTFYDPDRIRLKS